MRYIYTNAVSRDIPDLLQSILISELIRPSNSLFLASPWVSDIPVIRNRSNEFILLNPQWARKDIMFTDVIAELIGRGTEFYLETRLVSANQRFIENIRKKVVKPWDNIRFSPVLHRKGLLGDGYFLSGSMNFTYNGITTLEEYVHFTIDSTAVAENRIVWERSWVREGE